MRAIAAAALALCACQIDSNGNGAGPVSPNKLAAQLQAVSQRMHTRYLGAHRLLAAIGRSDLEVTKLEAHALSVLDEPDVLPEWRPYFVAVSDAATDIELTADVAAAGRGLATLGARCLSCHVATHAQPKLAPLPRGPTRMLEHQQAAIAMWDGLVISSDEHWLAGADVLATSPLAMVARAATPEWPEDVDDVARLRMYAQRAKHVTAPADRVELFGTIVTTCTHCHAALRDRQALNR